MVNPANGPISINEYYGDAIFRSGQAVSTISRKLVDKLGLNIQTQIINGKTRFVVQPRITIGTYNYEVVYPMFIQEDYFRGKIDNFMKKAYFFPGNFLRYCTSSIYFV